MKSLVIIPTYNEKENIKGIIEAVLKVTPKSHILIVDDNSPDGTGEIVKGLMKQDERIHLLQREKKMGLGTAYVAGFKYAIEKNYDCVVQMDADFSHNPNDIPRLFKEIGEYDLVIGSRYKDGISVVNWPLSRLFLSYFANVYARVITGVPIRDLTGGFKCIKVDVLKAIDLDSVKADGYGFQIEINFLAYINGFKIKEVPIIFIDRRAGYSKMSKKIIWEAFWLVLKLRLERIKGLKRKEKVNPS